MSILVEQQDETIDVIEETASHVEKDTEAGLGHTTKAVDSARAARKKRWICFGLFGLLLAIIAIVIAVVILNNRKSERFCMLGVTCSLTAVLRINALGSSRYQCHAEICSYTRRSKLFSIYLFYHSHAQVSGIHGSLPFKRLFVLLCGFRVCWLYMHLFMSSIPYGGRPTRRPGFKTSRVHQKIGRALSYSEADASY